MISLNGLWDAPSAVEENEDCGTVSLSAFEYSWPVYAREKIKITGGGSGGDLYSTTGGCASSALPVDKESTAPIPAPADIVIISSNEKKKEEEKSVVIEPPAPDEEKAGLIDVEALEWSGLSDFYKDMCAAAKLVDGGVEEDIILIDNKSNIFDCDMDVCIIQQEDKETLLATAAPIPTPSEKDHYKTMGGGGYATCASAPSPELPVEKDTVMISNNEKNKGILIPTTSTPIEKEDDEMDSDLEAWAENLEESMVAEAAEDNEMDRDIVNNNSNMYNNNNIEGDHHDSLPFYEDHQQGNNSYYNKNQALQQQQYYHNGYKLMPQQAMQMQMAQPAMMQMPPASDPPNAIKKRAPRKPWSKEEHLLFLQGLEKHGKGAWKAISSNFIPSRCAKQIASHAQKYFQRQQAKHNQVASTSRTANPDTANPNPKPRKKRASIHDTPFPPQ